MDTRITVCWCCVYSQRHRHLQAVPLHVLQQYNPQAKQVRACSRIPCHRIPSACLRSMPPLFLNTQPPCPLQAVPMDSVMDAFLATHGSPPSASFSLPSLPFRHRFLLLPDDDPGMHPTQHRLPHELCLGKSTLGYVASKHP